MKKIMLLMLTGLLLFSPVLCGAVRAPEPSPAAEEALFPAGVYEGDMGSVLTLYDSGLADYEEADLSLTDNPWSYDGEVLSLTLEELSLSLRAEVPAEALSEQGFSFVLTSDNEDWVPETFTRAARDTENFLPSIPGLYQSEAGNRYLLYVDGTADYSEPPDLLVEDLRWTLEGDVLTVTFPAPLDFSVRAEISGTDLLSFTFTSDSEEWEEETFIKVPSATMEDEGFDYSLLEGTWYGNSESTLVFRRGGTAYYDHTNLDAASEENPWSVADDILTLTVVPFEEAEITADLSALAETGVLAFDSDSENWVHEEFTRGPALTPYMLEGSYSGEGDSFLILNRDGSAVYYEGETGYFNNTWRLSSGFCRVDLSDIGLTIRADVRSGDTDSLLFTGDPELWDEEVFTRNRTLYFPQAPAREKGPDPALEGAQPVPYETAGLSFSLPEGVLPADELGPVSARTFLLETTEQGDDVGLALLQIDYACFSGEDRLVLDYGSEIAAAFQEEDPDFPVEYIETALDGLPAGTFVFRADVGTPLENYVCIVNDPGTDMYYQLSLRQSLRTEYDYLGLFTDFLDSVELVPPGEEEMEALRAAASPAVTGPVEDYAKALEDFRDFLIGLARTPAEEEPDVFALYSDRLGELFEVEEVYKEAADLAETREDYEYYTLRSGQLQLLLKTIFELLE